LVALAGLAACLVLPMTLAFGGGELAEMQAWLLAATAVYFAGGILYYRSRS
jgi:hypothetical protein